MKSSARLGSTLLRAAEVAFRQPSTQFPYIACCRSFCNDVASVNEVRSPSVVWLCSSTDSAPLQSVEKPAPVPPTPEITPKEVLLQVDYLLESNLRQFFKHSGKTPSAESLFHKDVEYQDRLYGYNASGIANLRFHISKMKIYLRYKSAFNRIDHLGSAIYENEDVIVTLYRWRFMESHWASWRALTHRAKYAEREAVLDFHVNPDGKIYRIVHREATETDRQDVESMNKIKAETADAAAKANEKATRKLAEEQWRKENEGADNPYRPS